MSKRNDSLANAVAVLLGVSGFWWGITMPSPVLGTAVSVGSVAAMEAHRRKYGYTYQNVLGEAVDASVPLLEVAAESLREMEPAEDAAPIIKWGYSFVRWGLDAGKESEADLYRWFTEMEFGFDPGQVPYGSLLVCGEAREGKTHAAKHIFRRFLEQHPQAKILVCDVEAHTHEDPNYWFGCPVAASVDEVAQAFTEVDSYISLAKGDGSDPGLVVLLDEAQDTFEQLGKRLDQVAAIMKRINVRGGKRKVLFISIMHSLAGGVLNLPGIKDYLPKCNILMLPRFAYDDANFNNLQASDEREECRNKLKLYPLPPLASPDTKPCLLYSNKQWSIRIIPSLESTNLIIKEGEPTAEEAADVDLSLIQEYIEGVELPDRELGLRELQKLCGVDDANQRKKDRPVYWQWTQFLEMHNARIRGVETPDTTDTDPLTPPSNPGRTAGVA
ncbi:MAG: hypothetical protein VKK04_25645 [Synechococcales bacterium]|nr:hypothetical protein [Synechococcales bacterium]